MRKPQPLTRAALAATLAAALVSACAGLSGIPVQSLRGADVPVADTAPPEAKQYLGKRPGTAGQAKIARSFEQQPPLIPHALTNFDDITLEENQCLTCHDVDVYEKKKAPKIGDSHFKDREGKVHKTVVMARWQCTQCHVPQVDAKPLVDNTFQAAAPAKAP
jgi:cytochrome c-type protein NapB